MYETSKTTRVIGAAAATVVTFVMVAAIGAYANNANLLALSASGVVQLDPITITGQRSSEKKATPTAAADEVAKAKRI